MNNFESLAFGRRSIRKFQDKDIPLSDIDEIIRIATSAPSGCNSQCWRFIAIKDKAVIQSISDAVIQGIEALLEEKKDELPENYLNSKRKMVSFFVNAPVVIAVFMTKLDYYDPLVTSALESKGYTYEETMKFFAYPDILSIGAAIQNLLLAVHEKGYGACWMNEPAVAGDEIRKILGENEESRFMSLIPVGIPAYVPRAKQMKDITKVYKTI
ncbi:MAG: nitroreductase family protein [Clostridia bacterium]|nr:nitroreductase family protein [Clostridia bacterium]